MDDDHVKDHVKLETLEFLQTDDHKKRRASSSSSGGGGGGKRGGGGAAPASCQAERCSADLAEAKKYHLRHKVCEFHAKAPVALVSGLHQRFCQQCSRFHELLEFDDTKRSCRRRLAGHNQRRRRKSSSGDPNGESPPPSSGTPESRHDQMKESGVKVYYN